MPAFFDSKRLVLRALKVRKLDESGNVRLFKRYADLFSEEEKRTRQRDVQNRRSEWRKAQAKNVVVMPQRQQPAAKGQQSAGVN